MVTGAWFGSLKPTTRQSTGGMPEASAVGVAVPALRLGAGRTREARASETMETILRWGVGGTRHGPGLCGDARRSDGHQPRRWEGLAETCAWRERSGVEGAIISRDRVGPRSQIRPSDHHPRLDERPPVRTRNR